MLHFGLSHLQNVNFNLGIPDIYFSFNAFHLFFLLFTDIRNTYFFCLGIKFWESGQKSYPFMLHKMWNCVSCKVVCIIFLIKVHSK